MYVIDIIREFNTAQFRVIVDAVEEDCPDLSWDDTGDVREGIDSGKFMVFAVRARVLDEEGEELAADYLGNCVYGSPAEFMDHRGIAGNREGIDL